MRSNLRALLSAACLLVATAAVAGPASQPATAKAESAPGGNPVVLIKTSMGDIKAELDRKNAPVSVDNFLNYVDTKFFDGTIFHRVISNFMIQGGGLTADMTKKPTRAPIKLESQNGLMNARGTLAMARTGNPDSATSQWFINVVDNKFLNYNASNKQANGYAVFGKVIDGMDVVDKIKSAKTGVKAGRKDVPLETITIESVRLIK